MVYWLPSGYHLLSVDLMMHDSRDLITLFNHCFQHTFHTVLAGGFDEPFYAPATDTALARIEFTRDYFASALHEIAHWCIAGEQRRTLEDYGYWYQPDGRTEEQQCLFEQVEVRPQALEWLFAACCRWPFRISADNLNGCQGASDAFLQAVTQEAQIIQKSTAGRAHTFALALARHYNNGQWPDAHLFTLSRLQTPAGCQSVFSAPAAG